MYVNWYKKSNVNKSEIILILKNYNEDLKKRSYSLDLFLLVYGESDFWKRFRF